MLRVMKFLVVLILLWVIVVMWRRVNSMCLVSSCMLNLGYDGMVRLSCFGWMVVIVVLVSVMVCDSVGCGLGRVGVLEGMVVFVVLVMGIVCVTELVIYWLVCLG